MKSTNQLLKEIDMQKTYGILKSAMIAAGREKGLGFTKMSETCGFDVSTNEIAPLGSSETVVAFVTTDQPGENYPIDFRATVSAILRAS
jgi:hypothetical protein